MARPRPPSARIAPGTGSGWPGSGTSISPGTGSSRPGSGTPAPPASVTATLATPSRGQSTSTVNVPPRPEVVCAIAFVASSDTQITRISLAGQPSSRLPTNLRASDTEAGIPGKVRALVPHEGPQRHWRAGAGRTGPLGSGARTGYAAVTVGHPLTSSSYCKSRTDAQNGSIGGLFGPAGALRYGRRHI